MKNVSTPKELIMKNSKAVVILCCLSIFSCSERIKKDRISKQTIEEAEAFFEKVSHESAENRKWWDVQEFQIFGRDNLNLYALLANGEKLLGGASAHILSDTLVRVDIPFWFKGKTIDNEVIKLDREISIEFKPGISESDWEITGFRIDDQPLGFIKQALYWAGLSLVAPLLFWGMMMIFLQDFRKAIGCLTVFVGILALPLSGYYGWVCFGSMVAVFVCPVITILLFGKLIGKTIQTGTGILKD